jgi:hypothetical protein
LSQDAAAVKAVDQKSVADLSSILGGATTAQAADPLTSLVVPAATSLGSASFTPDVQPADPTSPLGLSNILSAAQSLSQATASQVVPPEMPAIPSLTPEPAPPVIAA